MKKNRIFMFMLAGVLAWTAQVNEVSAQHQGHDMSQPEFKDAQTKTAWEHYLHVKDALVASDAGAATEGAAALGKSLQEVEGGGKAAGLAAKIAVKDDLAAQREAFASLSKEMASLFKSSGLASGKLYLAHCPMAMNNQGASWLSASSEIRNPYFGDKMLKCGMVKETIQ